MARLTIPAARVKVLALAMFLLVGSSCLTGAVEPAPFMMRAQIGSQLVEGQPLQWSKEQILLLSRDGALVEFDPAAAEGAKRIAGGFVPFSSNEMAARLQAEFPGSEVTSTNHFVVVHPRGQWRAWAERLESLYRGFAQYMSVRGFPVQQPATPLTAIVFRDGSAYHSYAEASGTPMQPGTMGHYDLNNNRVFLFDAYGSEDPDAWAANAATIIHEATHQTAYNVGVHQRFAEQPRWVAEGLAMMFEAEGVWNAASLHGQERRINLERLDYFRATAADRPGDWLVQIVASDRPFQTDVLRAYAEAWTLTFYLCETRPQEYSAYLSRTARREPFSRYTQLERVTDFTEVFGGDLAILEAQLARYVEELP